MTKPAGIEYAAAAHPIPDERGVAAARRALEIAGRAGEKDIVFVCVSGGGSSLLCLPAEGIALEEKRLVTDALVRAGAFRSDLFHRLNVVPLDIPPLRERVEDLPLLLKHYARAFARGHGRPASSFRFAALNALKAYGWPGNVHELRNLCERLAILLPGVSVGLENLPVAMRAPSRDASATGFRLPAGGIDLNLLERDVIRQALELAAGNRSQAARLLGITRDTLLYRMQKYGLAA